MRQTRSGRINTEAVIKLFILMGFALFFYITIKSGNAQKYVHPRIVPYMKFGIAAMVLVSVFTAGTVFKPRKTKANLLPYLLFIIPLICAFALPAKTIEAASISGNGLKAAQIAGGTAGAEAPKSYGQGAGDASAAETQAILEGDDALTEDTEDNPGYFSDDAGQGSGTIEPGAAASSDAPEDTVESAAYAEESSDVSTDVPADASADISADSSSADYFKLSGDTISITDKNFVMWNNELYDNMEKYKDKKIRITGKVLKDEELKADEFGVIRLMMSCCVADLQPVGLICRYSGSGGLEKDSWVTVTGKIVLEEYEGEIYPIIAVNAVQSAEKPKDEYVYP